MGYLKYVRKLWKKPQANLGSLWKERLMQFRREPVTIRLERPTRLDRARSLGYRAKKGFVVVRQRVQRGGHTRPHDRGGRRTKTQTRRLVLSKNYKVIAEERAQRKYKNLAVLNSYWVAQDGKNYWFEIILVDPSAPEIRADPKINWICDKKHWSRVFHGKTSAGRKMRGLRGRKGKGAEKVRPSRTANIKKKNK
ncbi:50S ribosomal protein L15e [Candidatus Woesearchaeota archaeon]|nr:50S ribosomal protein L15e [Candidatus Woesearchaeota archaeon]